MRYFLITFRVRNSDFSGREQRLVEANNYQEACDMIEHQIPFAYAFADLTIHRWNLDMDRQGL